MHDPYLAHYGVKGMKWGVRRARRMSEKRDARRKQANERAEALEKSAPGSEQAIKARSRATKVGQSRYGQTNPRIVGEAILRNIGTSLVGNVLTSAALGRGNAEVAQILSGTTNLANLGIYGNMAYKLYKNYQ